MRKLIVSLALGAFLVTAGSGCIVHTRPHGHRQGAVKKGGCAPSHYWDGHQCRHKGKGKGARKHDY